MTNSDPRFSAGSAPVLTERLIQAAVDYEQGRCSSRELAEARAAVEAAIPADAQSVGMREALERIAKQQLVEERLVEGGDYEYGYEQIVKIARAALASQPSPAATVEMDTSEGCRCMFCGARTLTTCTPEKPAEGCLRPRLSADTGEAGDPIRWIKDTYLMWLKGDLDPAHMRLGQHFFRAPPQTPSLPVEAIRAAVTLLARKITKLSWSRDDCRRKGQDVYVANLTAQIDKLDGYYSALSALAVSRPPSQCDDATSQHPSQQGNCK
jgi:hypothetical protein